MKEFSPKSFQTNSFFTQGHSHLVCEDYAIHGDNFFIVADGCSSAKNSDVSARLLTWSAIKNLDKLIDSFGSDNDQEFVTAVSQDIRKSAEAIHFQERLLATLLVGVVTHDQVLISVYGDGNVVTRNKNGIWEVFHIEYQSNAPYYLYYRGDAKESASYDHLFKSVNKKVFQASQISPEIRKEEEEFPNGLKAERFAFPIDDYDFIGVLSDGVETFYNPQTGEKIDYESAIKELVSFKSVSGEFIRRRCNKALKTWEKKKIYPFDDFSMAGVFINQE